MTLIDQTEDVVVVWNNRSSKRHTVTQSSLFLLYITNTISVIFNSKKKKTKQNNKPDQYPPNRSQSNNKPSNTAETQAPYHRSSFNWGKANGSSFLSGLDFFALNEITHLSKMCSPGAVNDAHLHLHKRFCFYPRNCYVHPSFASLIGELSPARLQIYLYLYCRYTEPKCSYIIGVFSRGTAIGRQSHYCNRDGGRDGRQRRESHFV